MRITVDVTDSREAAYAADMFLALEETMIANPPPLVAYTQNVIGDMSQTVLTGIPGSEAVTGLAGAATAATGARRGRKSAEQKAAEAAAKEAAEKAKGETAIRPGDALKGIGAEDLAAALSGRAPAGGAHPDAKSGALAAALEALPLVHQVGDLQVRTAPDTPLDEIAAMKVRLEKTAAEAQASAAGAAFIPSADAGAALAAAAATAAGPAAGAALDLASALGKVTPAATTAATNSAADLAAALGGGGAASSATAAGGLSADIAALFKPAGAVSEPTGSKYAGMSPEQLMTEFVGYLNGEGGLLWARAVMAEYKIESLNELTPDQIRSALENPAQFKK